MAGFGHCIGCPTHPTKCRVPTCATHALALQVDLSDLGAEAHSKYRYILVVIDHFSKHVWLRALKAKHSAEIARHVSGPAALVVLQGAGPHIVAAGTAAGKQAGQPAGQHRY